MATAGCEGGDSPAAPTSAPRATPMPTATSASVAAPTPSATAAPGAIATAAPTSAPRATPMPTATSASVATPTPSATAAQGAIATATPTPTNTAPTTPMPINTPTPVTTASISAGTYRVGADLAAGLYRGDGSTGTLGSCYWARLSGLSGEFDDLIANDNPEGQFFVEIMDTDAAFETGCTIEPVPDSDLTSAPPVVSSIAQGAYRIGIDIPAGLYRGDASNASYGSCYWARLSGFSGEFDDLIANDNTEGQFFVEIMDTDAAFSTSCTIEPVPDSDLTSTPPAVSSIAQGAYRIGIDIPAVCIAAMPVMPVTVPATGKG